MKLVTLCVAQLGQRIFENGSFGFRLAIIRGRHHENGRVSSVSAVTDVDARHAGRRSMPRRHAPCVGGHLWVTA